MTIDRYSSIKEVLEAVYRDTGYQHEIPHEDLIQWTVEAMELIGYPLQYVPKVIGKGQDANYEFTSYKVPLPCDFHKLQAVSVNGYPAVYRTNQFHHMLDPDCCGFDNVNTDIQDVFYTNLAAYSPQAGEYVNPAARTVMFDINDNFITFSIEKGNACLAYWAFPVDDEGFPMVPDIQKYKMAVTKYLIYKVDYILWRQGVINDKVYTESKDEWLWFVGSISSALKMPSVEQMEAIKLGMVRLIPRFHSYHTFFKDLLHNRDRI